MADSFAQRFQLARRRHGPLVWGLDPSAAVLHGWGLEDSPDGLERFVDVALAAAAGSIGVVKPQSAFYERHGWRGVRALARLIEEAKAAGLLVILDAKRGDIGSTNDAYAEAYLGADAAMAVDALTVTPYLGLAAMGSLVHRAHEAASALFVVTRSSNPEGRTVQAAVGADGRSVEQAILGEIGALNARLAPAEIGPIGAVIGPTHDGADLDLAAVNGLLLAPGLGAQGATPGDLAEVFAACPERVLPSASRSLLQPGPEVARLRDAIAQLAAEVRQALGS